MSNHNSLLGHVTDQSWDRRIVRRFSATHVQYLQYLHQTVDMDQVKNLAALTPFFLDLRSVRIPYQQHILLYTAQQYSGNLNKIDFYESDENTGIYPRNWIIKTENARDGFQLLRKVQTDCVHLRSGVNC